jgi:hypothetical protein
MNRYARRQKSQVACERRKIPMQLRSWYMYSKTGEYSIYPWDRRKAVLFAGMCYLEDMVGNCRNKFPYPKRAQTQKDSE